LDFVKRLLEIDPEKRPSAKEALNHPWIRDKYKIRSPPLSPLHPRYSSDRSESNYTKSRYSSRNNSTALSNSTNYNRPHPKCVYNNYENVPQPGENHHSYIETVPEYPLESSRTHDYYPISLVYTSHWDSLKPIPHYYNQMHRYEPYRSKYRHHNHRYPPCKYEYRYTDLQEYEKNDYDYHGDKYHRKSRSRNWDHHSSQYNRKRTSEEISDSWNNQIRYRRRRIENVAD